MDTTQNESNSAWKGQGKTGGKPQSEDTQVRGTQYPKPDQQAGQENPENRFSEEQNPDQEGLDKTQDVDNTRTGDMGSVSPGNKEVDNKNHGEQHKEGLQSNADQNSAVRKNSEASNTTGTTPGISGQTGGQMGSNLGSKKDRSTEEGL